MAGEGSDMAPNTVVVLLPWRIHPAGLRPLKRQTSAKKAPAYVTDLEQARVEMAMVGMAYAATSSQQLPRLCGVMR